MRDPLPYDPAPFSFVTCATNRLRFPLGLVSELRPRNHLSRLPRRILENARLAASVCRPSRL